MQDGKASRLIFTPPSAEEERSIREGLTSLITEKAVNQLLVGQHLILAKGHRQEVFLLSPILWELYEQVQPQNPYFIGLFVGELKKGTLRPSLHILQRLVDDVKSSAKVIAVSKGEQKFLYGHPLELQELEIEVTDSDKMKQVLVVNEQGEGLGYGRLVKTSKGVQVLKNQLDLGWYLRRGQ